MRRNQRRWKEALPKPAPILLPALLGLRALAGSPALGVVEPLPRPEEIAAPAAAEPTRAARSGAAVAAPRGWLPGSWAEAARHLAAEFPQEDWPPEMEAVDRIETPRVTYLRFRQAVAGHPVIGSSAVIAWHRSGRAAEARATWFPRLPEKHGLEATPAIPLEEAQRVLLEDERFAPPPATEQIDAAETAWLPLRAAGPGGADVEISLVLVWIVRAVTEAGTRWEGWVDAHSGRLLARWDRTAHAELSGRILGAIEPETSGDPAVLRPMPALAVQAAQRTFIARDTSGAEGAVRLELPEAGSARLTMELRGSRAWVRDASRGLSTPLDTLTAAVPGTFELRWDDANSTASQRDAYYHVVRAHDAVRALDPGEALRPLDQPMQVRVDDPTGACNAYWNGSRLNFYAQGSGCVAAARVADVVYHEYGHAVSDLCYAPYPIPGDMNEAFSDYFAASLSDQPYIGVGFYGPGTHIRDLERDRVWPRDANPSAHQQGLILAGALWDLRKELGASRTDSLFHFARYGAAQSFDEYLLDVLIQDDDDGDLDDGTPHFPAIIGAFRAHGIGDYRVTIDHARLPDVESPAPEILAVARVRSLLALAPDSVAFLYSTGGAYTRVRPSGTGLPREFRASLPTPADGTAVRYYWSAADTAGHRATLPPGAPDSCFTFFVGADVVPPRIEHDPIPPTTEGVAALGLRARITDNSDRLGEAAAIVRRAGSAESTRVTLDLFDGPDLRRGEAPLEPPLEGDTLLYRIEASDRAGTPNLARWPEGGEWQRVPVRRGWTETFEAAPGAFVPEGGWSWGAPAPPVRTWSGARLWGVVLGGAYAANASAALVIGPLDLRGWDRARLELRHLYRMEPGYDGGRVEWSYGQHGPWTVLTPRDSYPSAVVRALEGPGYSGDSGDWRRAIFPLDSFLGDRVWLRFRFESDARVEDLGWFLDDVALVGAQCPSPPQFLRAAECGADCIALRWAAPADIDTASARFLGYRVERAREAGEFVPLTPDPIAGLRLEDRGLETGVTYRYRVLALYDEEASAALEAAAAPFAPAMELPLQEIAYELRGVARSDTSFLIGNATGGTLRFNAYLGDSGAGWSDLRLRYPRGSSAAWLPLWRDSTQSPGAGPRLAELSVRDREDAEIGAALEIRLRGAEPWGDPEGDWGGLVWIDTDDNLATGRIDANLGAEYLLAFGRAAREAGHDGPAVLLNPVLRPLQGLTGALLPAGADSILLLLPWAAIDRPYDVRLKVALAAGLLAPPFQEAPRAPALRWLAREPRYGRALPGHPQPFELSFDASAMGNGTYRAVLGLESNDASTPLRLLPITLRVRGIIPQDLAELEFVSAARGVAISFRLPPDPTPLGAAVERSDAGLSRWSVLTPEPLVPDSTGAFRFLDRAVEPGREYLYRFRVGFAPQEFVLFGPYPAAYLPPIPAALALSAPQPNPLRAAAGATAELRADLPEPGRIEVDVFDAAGRRVRRLAEGTCAAGPHWLDWDARDDRGREVPAGSYWIRLLTPQGRRSVRAVIVR